MMVRILVRNIGPMNKNAGKKERAVLLSKTGRELLELGASRYYGLCRGNEPERKRMLETDRNPWGKPYLVHYPWLHFNISHSGTYVACAFGERPVGLDLQVCADADYLRIADRFFSRSDRDRMHSAADIRRMFYRIWTQEESYAKWKGNGLSENIGMEEKEGVCHWFEPAENVQGALWSEITEELWISNV